MTYSEFAKKSEAIDGKFSIDDETDMDVENMFWRSVKSKKQMERVYGIDIPISLFPDSCKEWNMNKLSGKDTIIHSLDNELEGILSPFLYIGMRNTAFGYHVEDSYLLSINVLHQGKANTWYAVPHSERHKLEEFVKAATAQYKCDFLIRHKLILIPPSELKKMGIKFEKVSDNNDQFEIIKLTNQLNISIF